MFLGVRIANLLGHVPAQLLPYMCYIIAKVCPGVGGLKEVTLHGCRTNIQVSDSTHTQKWEGVFKVVFRIDFKGYCFAGIWILLRESGIRLCCPATVGLM